MSLHLQRAERVYGRMGENRKFSDEEMLDCLREASLDDGTSINVYDEWLEQHHGPTSAAICARFGSWNAAVQKAGLVAKPTNRVYERISQHECVQAVVTAAKAKGDLPSVREYDLWRVRQQPGDYPCSALIRRRCGGWVAALRMAQRERK